MLDTPVALIIFNRPNLAELVFRAIAQARPRRLFVIADGPRSPDEAELCARTRAVTQKVDWDCDVKTDFSDVNLGCRRRCVSGFDWVFSQVDAAIILEDDCVPDPTFFRFCEVMLEHYCDDRRVMMITGSNYLESWKADSQSYHFSYLGSPWGWASWKRAWKFYDDTMTSWGDEEIKAQIRDLLADEDCFAFQARRFDAIYANPGDRHVWDLKWSFARLMQAGLTVVPAVNLISNRGCLGGKSLPPTHPLANLPTVPMPFPLRIQSSVGVDRLYDERHVRRIYEWYRRQAAGREQVSTEPHVEAGGMYRRIARKVGRRLASTLRRSARVGGPILDRARTSWRAMVG